MEETSTRAAALGGGRLLHNGIKLASSAVQQGLWPPDIINLHRLPPVLSSSSR